MSVSVSRDLQRPTTVEMATAGLPAATRPLLDVADLTVRFEGRGKRVEVVSSLSYAVTKGRTLAIIGESGSGKSISCRALLGLLPHGAIATGSVRYEGKELIGLSDAEMQRYRGNGLAMVFQDAERALNPTMRIGPQICEAIHAHRLCSGKAAKGRVVELLHTLKLPAPHKLFAAYPHELSGGMRQRVMIAIAIAASPKLLIADEPTSSLDASTGAEIMALLVELQQQLGMALIMVSHDLRLVANFADTVLVMRAGRAIECAATSRLMTDPQTEYTKALLAAIPALQPRQKSVPDAAASPPGRAWPAGVLAAPHHSAEGTPVAGDPTPSSSDCGPLLRVCGLVQELPGRGYAWSRGPRVRALCEVSFDLMRGEVLGIVGETGAGKSTLVRTLLQMPPPTGGSVWFRGHALTELHGRRLGEQRCRMQAVFQDPFASLNPKWQVRDIVEEPLIGLKFGDRQKRLRRVSEVLELVGLPYREYGTRRPSQLSGGQCQRVAIARALAPEPQLLLCDEALSSLDALIQEQIVALLQRLRVELELGMLFISHDLARVAEISDRIAVMYLGQLCEIGPAESLCRDPRHPYMVQLVARLGNFRRSTGRFSSNPPPLSAPPSGCRFRTRCDRAQERCAMEEPTLRRVADGHYVACHFPVTPDGGAAA